jgi:hypothetical protein
LAGVTGGPTLEELAPGVPSLMARWCGWSQAQEDSDEDDGVPDKSQTDILIGYAGDAELFRTPDEKAYAAFWVNDHQETWPVEGRRFERWLRRQYFEGHKKAPKSQPLREAIATITAKATFEGQEQQVSVRVAGREDSVYVDLCNDS